MEKEIKEEALDNPVQEEAVDLQAEPEPAQAETPAAAPTEHPNGLAQKRGRIMVAGALTAVLLSAVAVIVAGIFGITSHWLKTCPLDVPVNDPARELSQQLTAEKIASQSRGVSGRIAEETRLKGVGSPQEKEITETGKVN